MGVILSPLGAGSLWEVSSISDRNSSSSVSSSPIVKERLEFRDPVSPEIKSYSNEHRECSKLINTIISLAKARAVFITDSWRQSEPDLQNFNQKIQIQNVKKYCLACNKCSE